MGNHLGFHQSLLRITVYGAQPFCTRTCCSLPLKHCQRHTLLNIFKRTITVPTVKLHIFYCKTKSSQEMDTENVSCQDGKQHADDLTASCETTGLFEQTKDVAEKPLSKRALKRIARAQKHKEYKKRKREESLQLIQRDDVGCSVEDLQQTSYYFENGVRKVYPYSYVFATHAKGRWVGRRIQDVLEKEFGYDQPDDLVKSFEKGMIHVNGKQATLDYVLHDNDYISHRTHRHENPVTAAPIEVLENNEDLIVINKPSSIPCHPCGRYRFNSVVFILGKEMGLVNLRNIYRLDRLTSGVLILGKSPGKTKVLMDQVANRQVQKEYVCRVVGKFPDGPVKVDQPLKALSNKLRLQVISPSGKSSQTTFTRVSYNGKSSVVRCIPHTGRTHQIRVHLQYLGHPILNDAFYNSDAWGPSRGKNGAYEVSHDKVCEQILAEHHKNIWAAGENPMYGEKIREMKAKEQLSVSISDHSKLAHVNSPHTGSIEEAYNSCADLPSSDELNFSGLCKSATKSTQEATALSQDATILPHNVQCLLTNSPDDSVVNPQLSPSMHLEVRPQPQDSSNYSVTNEKTVETSDLDSCSSKSQRRAQRQSFQMSKWSVDPSCDLCKRLPIDPEEKHLVMFLHAIKYKGPGWEYETALPEWASEDWSREQEFILGTSNCMSS